MFGMMEALLGFVRRQMGLRSDAPSASGSVHAKLGDIANKIGASSDARENNTVMGWLNSPIKSIQRGITELTVNQSTTNVTISAVNTSKAFVVSSHSNSLNITSGDKHGFNARVRLTSSTNLEIYRHYTSDHRFAGVYVAWEVIEFY